MSRRGAIFIDRDGTLIVERHYLSDPAQVNLERGVREGLRNLSGLGLPMIVLSNQSGVGRGLFTMDDVASVNSRVNELLASSKIALDGWYVCPHAPEAGCECRKPKPGLPLRAAEEHRIDLSASYVLGDKDVDLRLAAAIGARGALILSGHGVQHRAAATATAAPAFATFAEAAEWVRHDVSTRG